MTQSLRHLSMDEPDRNPKFWWPEKTPADWLMAVHMVFHLFRTRSGVAQDAGLLPALFGPKVKLFLKSLFDK